MTKLILMIFVCTFSFTLTRAQIFDDPQIAAELIRVRNSYFSGQNTGSSVYSGLTRIVTNKLISVNITALTKATWQRTPARVQHFLNMLQNAMTVGFLDAVVKEGYLMRQGYPNFIRSDGPLLGYANLITGLQTTSALEYALNQGDDLIEVARFFMAQALLSSIVEHLGYWIYINSSIPIHKYGKPMGWRGSRYPNNPNSNNDVPWMSGTLAGYISQFLYGDPSGVVRKEAIFVAFGIAAVASYFITPDKGGAVKPNTYSGFEIMFFLDGHDENRITGLGWGSKLGLKYNIPINIFSLQPAITFYQSSRLEPRTQFSLQGKSNFLGVTLNADKNGLINGFDIDVLLKF